MKLQYLNASFHLTLFLLLTMRYEYFLSHYIFFQNTILNDYVFRIAWIMIYSLMISQYWTGFIKGYHKTVL